MEFGARLGCHWMTVSRWERMGGYLPSKRSMNRFEEIEQEYLRKLAEQ